MIISLLLVTAMSASAQPSVDLDALLSGSFAQAGAAVRSSVAQKTAAQAPAAVRTSAAEPSYPQLIPCEKVMEKEFGVGLRNAKGDPITGYSYGTFGLVLLTKTDAYYHHNDCDICSEITKCSLQSLKVSTVITAHSVSCRDMAPYAKDVVFDSCAAGR